MNRKKTNKQIQLDTIKHSERCVRTVRPAIFENKRRKARMKLSREKIFSEKF